MQFNLLWCQMDPLQTSISAGRAETTPSAHGREQLTPNGMNDEAGWGAGIPPAGSLLVGHALPVLALPPHDLDNARVDRQMTLEASRLTPETEAVHLVADPA